MVCGSMRTSTRRRLASNRFISFIRPTELLRSCFPGFTDYLHLTAFALEQAPMLGQFFTRNQARRSHIESPAAETIFRLQAKRLVRVGEKIAARDFAFHQHRLAEAFPADHVRNFTAGAGLLGEDDAASVCMAQPLNSSLNQLRVFRLGRCSRSCCCCNPNSSAGKYRKSGGHGEFSDAPYSDSRIGVSAGAGSAGLQARGKKARPIPGFSR